MANCISTKMPRQYNGQMISTNCTEKIEYQFTGKYIQKLPHIITTVKIQNESDV